MKKTLIIVLSLISLNISTALSVETQKKSKIQKVTCDTIDNTKTYQGLCTSGSRSDAECKYYTMVENFGDVPSSGPMISKTPYFIKTPDMKIEDIVNCETFKGGITSSNIYKDDLYYSLTSIKVNGKWIPSANENTNVAIAKTKEELSKKGNLFVDFFKMAKRDEDFAKEMMQTFVKDVKYYNDLKTDDENIVISNVSKLDYAIFLNDITIAQAIFFKHRYTSNLYSFTWTRGRKNIYL